MIGLSVNWSGTTSHLNIWNIYINGHKQTVWASFQLIEIREFYETWGKKTLSIEWIELLWIPSFCLLFYQNLLFFTLACGADDVAFQIKRYIHIVIFQLSTLN